MTGLLSPFPSPPGDPLPLLHLFSLRPSFLQQETLTESSLLKNFPGKSVLRVKHEFSKRAFPKRTYFLKYWVVRIV